MHAHVHTHTYTHTHAHAPTGIHTSAHMHACMHACMHAQIHIFHGANLQVLEPHQWTEGWHHWHLGAGAWRVLWMLSALNILQPVAWGARLEAGMLPTRSWLLHEHEHTWGRVQWFFEGICCMWYAVWPAGAGCKAVPSILENEDVE